MRNYPTLFALLAVQALGAPSLRAQFLAPLPTRPVREGIRVTTSTDTTKAANTPVEAPRAIVFPALGSGFSSDRAYVVTTAFSGNGRIMGEPFKVDIAAAKVVATSDETDPAKRKIIRDTKSLITTLVENSGDVSARFYATTSPLANAKKASATGNSARTDNLVYGLSAGSYSPPSGPAGAETSLAIGPMMQYTTAFRLTKGEGPEEIGSLVFGARAGLVGLTGGAIPDLPDSRFIRYLSGTAALISSDVMMFGATITWTQKSLHDYLPTLQVSASASVK